MVIESLDDYVSVPEAATILKVSPSTIWRWIDRGDVRASRIGRRRVKIKRSDLTRVVTPVRAARIEMDTMRYATIDEIRSGRRRLTAEQKAQYVRALDEARRFREELLARRGGVPLPSSTELIREMREERTQHLMDVIEGRPDTLTDQ